MEIKNVTIIGANGTMGKNVAAIFASFGDAKVYLVCRDMEKANRAVKEAYMSIRTEAIKEKLIPITYDNLNDAIKESDLIFESLNENFEIKTEIYEKIKNNVNTNTIIASGTSGLSIEKLSKSFGSNANNFFGIHFFNPPYVLNFCELIVHNEKQKEKAEELKNYLKNKLKRTVVLTTDTPSFLGNRIGFFFINNALRLAEINIDYGGIDYIDSILGSFTGRNMPPLVTANFVRIRYIKIDY